MGLILPQLIETSLNGGTFSYYENLGYNITKIYNPKTYKYSTPRNTKIMVHVLDLTKSSNMSVRVQCDICGKVHELMNSKFNINIERNNGLYICDNKSLHSEITAENKLSVIISDIKTFYNINNRFPKYFEYTKENGFTYNYSKMMDIISKHNTSLNNILNDIDCFKTTNPSIKYYDQYLSRLLEIISNSDLGTSLYGLSRDNNCKKYELPNIRWFIENCPEKNVTDISSFKKWAGIYENYLTKEQCEDIILKMSNEYSRPLMYDDFRGTGYGHVSISMINNYWGSLNKMKKELGLEIVQESMVDKQLTKEETVNETLNICNYIKTQDRDFTTTREIDDLSSTVTSGTLRKMIKKYFNLTLPEYFEKYNIRLGKEGNGIVYNFDDGERTTSQFEYMFSKYLRDIGLEYNKDYFRDVKYKDFIPNYNNMMNCDYVIRLNGKTIYIEIAGIIEAYKTWYYEDKHITMSKSKEKYRLKLKEKEQMLKYNNLIYFILFPCDLTRDIFMQIINDGSLELRHNIEKFMKNNIDWVKIQDIGELKYKENETSRSGQLIVDYKEVS